MLIEQLALLLAGWLWALAPDTVRVVLPALLICWIGCLPFGFVACLLGVWLAWELACLSACLHAMLACSSACLASWLLCCPGFPLQLLPAVCTYCPLTLINFACRVLCTVPFQFQCPGGTVGGLQWGSNNQLVCPQ